MQASAWCTRGQLPLWQPKKRHGTISELQGWPNAGTVSVANRAFYPVLAQDAVVGIVTHGRPRVTSAFVAVADGRVVVLDGMNTRIARATPDGGWQDVHDLHAIVAPGSTPTHFTIIDIRFRETAESAQWTSVANASSTPVVRTAAQAIESIEVDGGIGSIGLSDMETSMKKWATLESPHPTHPRHVTVFSAYPGVSIRTAERAGGLDVFARFPEFSATPHDRLLGTLPLGKIDRMWCWAWGIVCVLPTGSVRIMCASGLQSILPTIAGAAPPNAITVDDASGTMFIWSPGARAPVRYIPVDDTAMSGIVTTQRLASSTAAVSISRMTRTESKQERKGVVSIDISVVPVASKRASQRVDIASPLASAIAIAASFMCGQPTLNTVNLHTNNAPDSEVSDALRQAAAPINMSISADDGIIRIERVQHPTNTLTNLPVWFLGIASFLEASSFGMLSECPPLMSSIAYMASRGDGLRAPLASISTRTIFARWLADPSNRTVVNLKKVIIGSAPRQWQWVRTALGSPFSLRWVQLAHLGIDESISSERNEPLSLTLDRADVPVSSRSWLHSSVWPAVHTFLDTVHSTQPDEHHSIASRVNHVLAVGSGQLAYVSGSDASIVHDTERANAYQLITMSEIEFADDIIVLIGWPGRTWDAFVAYAMHAAALFCVLTLPRDPVRAMTDMCLVELYARVQPKFATLVWADLKHYVHATSKDAFGALDKSEAVSPNVAFHQDALREETMFVCRQHLLQLQTTAASFALRLPYGRRTLLSVSTRDPINHNVDFHSWIGKVTSLPGGAKLIDSAFDSLTNYRLNPRSRMWWERRSNMVDNEHARKLNQFNVWVSIGRFMSCLRAGLQRNWWPSEDDTFSVPEAEDLRDMMHATQMSPDGVLSALNSGHATAVEDGPTGWLSGRIRTFGHELHMCTAPVAYASYRSDMPVLMFQAWSLLEMGKMAHIEQTWPVSKDTVPSAETTAFVSAFYLIVSWVTGALYRHRGHTPPPRRSRLQWCARHLASHAKVDPRAAWTLAKFMDENSASFSGVRAKIRADTKALLVHVSSVTKAVAGLCLSEDGRVGPRPVCVSGRPAFSVRSTRDSDREDSYDSDETNDSDSDATNDSDSHSGSDEDHKDDADDSVAPTPGQSIVTVSTDSSSAASNDALMDEDKSAASVDSEDDEKHPVQQQQPLPREDPVMIPPTPESDFGNDEPNAQVDSDFGDDVPPLQQPIKRGTVEIKGTPSSAFSTISSFSSASSESPENFDIDDSTVDQRASTPRKANRRRTGTKIPCACSECACGRGFRRMVTAQCPVCKCGPLGRAFTIQYDSRYQPEPIDAMDIESDSSHSEHRRRESDKKKVAAIESEIDRYIANRDSDRKANPTSSRRRPRPSAAKRSPFLDQAVQNAFFSKGSRSSKSGRSSVPDQDSASQTQTQTQHHEEFARILKQAETNEQARVEKRNASDEKAHQEWVQRAGNALVIAGTPSTPPFMPGQVHPRDSSTRSEHHKRARRVIPGSGVSSGLFSCPANEGRPGLSCSAAELASFHTPTAHSTALGNVDGHFMAHATPEPFHTFQSQMDWLLPPLLSAIVPLYIEQVMAEALVHKV